MLGNVTVHPKGRTVSVNFLNPNGSQATAFLDNGTGLPATLPQTISAPTTYYLFPGSYLLSALEHGLEIAGDAGQRRALLVEKGRGVGISVDRDVPEQAAREAQLLPVETAKQTYVASVIAADPSGDATGVTDRTNLQAALTSAGNAAALSGGRVRVVLKPGAAYRTALTTSTITPTSYNAVRYALTMPAGVILDGQGARLGVPYTVDAGLPDAAGIITVGSRHTIHNLTFDGLETTEPAEQPHWGVLFNNGTDALVTDCEFTQFRGKGYVGFDVTRLTAERNRFHRTKGNSADHVRCTDVIVTGNNSYDHYTTLAGGDNSGAETWFFTDCTRVRFTDNLSRAWGPLVALAVGGRDIVIAGNTGILALGPPGQIVSGNIRIDSGTYDRVVIRDNVLDNSPTRTELFDGIQAARTSTTLSNVVITGNTIKRAPARGGGILLNLAGGQTNLLVADNYVHGASTNTRGTVDVGNNWDGVQVVGNIGRDGGISVGDGTRAVIANNLITGSGSALTCLTPNAEISGNYFESSGTGGTVDLFAAVTFTGNTVVHTGTFSDNGLAAVQFRGVGSTAINNRVIAGTNGLCMRDVTAEGGGQTKYLDNVLSGGNGNLLNPAGSSLVRGNAGYRTENHGAATVANGGTVDHGLSRTPTSVVAASTVSGHIVTVANLTGNNGLAFTVNITKHDGTSVTVAEPIYWHARS